MVDYYAFPTGLQAGKYLRDHGFSLSGFSVVPAELPADYPTKESVLDERRKNYLKTKLKVDLDVPFSTFHLIRRFLVFLEPQNEVMRNVQYQVANDLGMPTESGLYLYDKISEPPDLEDIISPDDYLQIVYNEAGVGEEPDKRRQMLVDLFRECEVPFDTDAPLDALEEQFLKEEGYLPPDIVSDVNTA